MPRDEELPIIRAFYDFVLWLNPKITTFPRDQRFVLSRCVLPARHAQTGQILGQAQNTRLRRSARAQ